MPSRFNIVRDPKDTFKHTVNLHGQKFSGFLSANVIIGSHSDADLEMMFGPLDEGEVIIEAPTNMKWPQLLSFLGIFPSAGQARKNGWDKDIAEGWSEALFKKQRKAVFVFKATQDV